jgi:hypothetical protein
VSDSRSDVDPEATCFLGGVLGTTRDASCRCDWGGADGMGSTISEANMGREGNGVVVRGRSA